VRLSEPTTEVHPASPGPRVLIAGAGITGLAAAYHIAKTRPDVELLLVEPRQRAGGNVETERRDGFLFDGGADTFVRTKPEAARLCAELGLAGDLVAPLPRGSGVYVGHKGHLVPMPAGMALAVPTRLMPLVKTPLIGLAGKLRILGDLWAPPTPQLDDETVAEFLTRHFGREVTDRLAGPLLGGIFSGDIDELSIRSTFPQLVALEKQHGSLIRALFAAERARVAQAQGKAIPKSDDPFDPVEIWSLFSWLRRETKPVPSPFQSLSGGIGSLISALVSRLPAQSIRLGRSVEHAERGSDGRWRVQLDGGEVELVERLLLCTPAHVAAKILAPHPVAAQLLGVPYVSTATVFFALGAEPKSCALDSSGFIVPRGEGRLSASTWVSSKWGGRAPEGGGLVRVFLGGARDPLLVESSSDEEMTSIAHDELTRFMGSLEPVLFTRVFRWQNSRPQPVVGHAARLRNIAELLRDAPGLHLAGAAYEGVGLSDCIRQGQAAATAALTALE
jgi:protoporphyrinogen/coproporphyrinogen III oxidase